MSRRSPIDHIAVLPCFLLALFLLVPASTPSQQHRLEFERLSVEHGLSFNQVNTIFQDSRGFMWFGTFNGLNKYDGYKFTVYKIVPGDSTSIPVGLTNALYEDSNGDIWANGVGQLARYDRARDRFVRYPRTSSVTTLYEEKNPADDTCRIWFASYGRGLHCYNEATKSMSFQVHKSSDPNSISSDSLTCVLVGQNGILWIGSTRGLTSLDEGRKQFRHYGEGPQRAIWQLCEDPDTSSGHLWIGAEDGLYLYNHLSGSFTEYRNTYGDLANDVRTIYRDRKGRLWIGTLGGIALFDDSRGTFLSYNDEIRANQWNDHKTWTFQEDNNGVLYVCGNGTPLRIFDEGTGQWKHISSASDHEYSVVTIYQDRSGTLWFGTWVDGVLKLDPSRKLFTMYKHVVGDETSLSSSLVTGISQDQAGNVWVGTHAGLNQLAKGSDEFKHYSHDQKNPSSLSGNVIYPVLEENERYLWVGTVGGGLERLDRVNSIFHHYLPDETVTGLHKGRDNTLWVGLSGGRLAQFDRTTDTFRVMFPRYAGGWGSWEVQAITEDNDGVIWMAVIGQGLISYDRNTATWGRPYTWIPDSPNWRNELSSLGPHALHVDHLGTLWIGTHRGLARFNKSMQTFTTYFRSELISGILEDDHGNFWISTTDGILKFNPSSETARRYDRTDGVEIGSWSGPTGHRGRTGEMFFGGSNGLLRFHPDSIRDNPHIPPVVITGFSKFNQPATLDSAITEKRAIELSYKDNMITFEFTALNYTSPEKNQYAYQMVGFDTGWIRSGTERKATYTNLDGGEYIFRVKGSNNDGIWNEEGASIAVIITPPFWETWWFRSVAFISVLLSVGGTIRYVEKKKLMRRIELLEQERALERERARISQDMHDEVGSSLSEIAILSELAKKKPEEADLHMQEISERAAEVIDSVSEIVWAMNPKNDTLDNLIAHVRRYAVKYLVIGGIKCKFNAPDDIPALHLSAEVRRNLFLMVKEALHNVVKHSRASEVSITARVSDPGLEIVIQDNGQGFRVAERPGAGNGLSSMSKRITAIGGVLKIESEPKKGTALTIHLPNSKY
jgi:signal transduction histidine kinase/ligand-binding sensor domain-containing protein